MLLAWMTFKKREETLLFQITFRVESVHFYCHRWQEI